jgi:SAM-dependent methyltransferase
MQSDPESSAELDAISRRYAQRRQASSDARYYPLEPANFMLVQERERRLIRWLRTSGLGVPSTIRLLEIGCGNGANLLQFLRLGFVPEHLVGNELLQDRLAEARHRLPAAVTVVPGNAAELSFPTGCFDVVFQSTVFTSILDEHLRALVARRMWSLVRPGGGVLWYDFVYDNPRNRDVRGVRLGQVREYFPEAEMHSWRVTLAPPIARRVARLWTPLYTGFNSMPWLRTHILCWLRKPA